MDAALSWFQIVAILGAGVAMVTDVRTGKIYNWLTFPMMVSGWLAHFLWAGVSGLAWSMAATLLGIALYLWLALFGLIGMGDVKLLGGIGAWGGCQYVIWVFLIASAVGLPHALFILYLNHGKQALAMLTTSYLTGSFLSKRLPDAQDPLQYKFYLGQDLFLGCLLARILHLPPLW
ncbi:MAG: Type IV prepilin peptidase TadV/CpaA [Candidatus Ozemobacter sibiricus]|jgi:prepilin peptidase CpaA|uniref:Type IV prepilin peptidase TadV/CpaA n=1 Tax=Candidatus Ozemobacter sibiricus TaxID=2268124 RepID=A0A367ZRH2_9BACT|nr:MAG: Type IV prepilin peptidase TadV/CpaA [Candidatus Ozemobacter sibiricus]